MLDRGEAVTLVASFWGPRQGEGYSRFVSEHIPGSVFCNPTSVLVGAPEFEIGRNPLPNVRRFGDWVQQSGLTQGTHIVVYDDGRGLLAARLWWTLRWAGFDKVQILDGGRAKWLAEDRAQLGGPGNLHPFSDYQITPGALPVMELEQVREFSGTIIDAREERRWAGRRELLDLRAGHIPGAVNIPVRSLLNEDLTVRGAEELRDIFGRAGIESADDARNACAYSGSGNHSAQLIAAMAEAGLPAPAHFIGGWSQWSCNYLPVETAL